MNKGIKKVISIIMTITLVAVLVVQNPLKIKAADSSGKWSVYYASGGGTGERTTVTLVSHGNGYVAKCSSISGSCTSRTVTIFAYKYSNLTNNIELNKSVEFTSKGSIVFKPAKPLNVNIVYFRVILTHKNGNSASATGTISINN